MIGHHCYQCSKVYKCKPRKRVNLSANAKANPRNAMFFVFTPLPLCLCLRYRWSHVVSASACASVARANQEKKRKHKPKGIDVTSSQLDFVLVSNPTVPVCFRFLAFASLMMHCLCLGLEHFFFTFCVDSRDAFHDAPCQLMVVCISLILLRPLHQL